MRYWYIRKDNGEEAFSRFDGDSYDPALGDDWTTVQEMPRDRGEFDRWDTDAQAFVVDLPFAEARIDAGHDVPAIHARKAMEARAFAASGYTDDTLAPLLSAEAADLGLVLADLCAEVIALDTQTIADELARRRAKAELRALAETQHP